MTFVEHLGELRKRLVRAVLAVVVGIALSFSFVERIFDLVARPMKLALAQVGVYSLKATEITETIFVYIKLSMVAGIVFSLPVTFYQLWAFIAPGLLEREKRAVLPLIFFSTLFFLLGVYFAYSVAIPFACQYLAVLAKETGGVELMVTVKSTFDFTLVLLLVFGATFELPLVMFFISLVGVLDHRQYLRFYRYWIVVAFIISGIVTPTPDPLNQTVLAVPLILLYGVGIIGAFFISKRRSEAERTLTPRELRVPSRVWGILSLGLAILAAGIGGGTWWLGRPTSALRWVPKDAVLVASVELDGLLGEGVAGPRRALLDRLGVPAEVPEFRRVVLGIDAAGERLLVLEGGCAGPVPSLGTCRDKDLIIAGEALADRAKEHGSVLGDRGLEALATRGPAWLRRTAPDAPWLGLLPGDLSGLGVTEVSLIATLRADASWLEVACQGASPGVAAAAQARMDLHRAEANQLAELRAQSTRGAATEAELLALLDALVVVAETEAALRGKPVAEPKELEAAQQQKKALTDRIQARRSALAPPPSTGNTAAGLVGRLPEAAVKSSQVSLDSDRALLRVELDPTSGPSALIGVIPPP